MFRANAIGPTLALILLSGGASAHARPIVTLAVDATAVAQRVLHCKETVAVEPGSHVFTYPKWIPGSHSPDDSIVNVVALRFSAGGKSLAWRRDDENMYAFHVEVPPGASALDITFDALGPVPSRDAHIGQSSAALAVLEWNNVVLSPEGPAREVDVRAHLTLPAGWSWASSLNGTRAGSSIDFQTVTLEQLIDSPVIAGAHLKTLALLPGTQPPHFIDLAADSAAALEAPAELVAGWNKLVGEAGALFGARHYSRYRFLLALSDLMRRGGLEHHQSSDNRSSERTLLDEEPRKLVAGLLPHEFVHSWCGKYRRPSGLATPDYQTPMKGELLWVYEGLTTYWGWVLMARSGLATLDLAKENLALTAALLEHRPGRAWRPLADTAVAAQILYRAPVHFTGVRRSVDFYPESALIWLEADTIIRTRSRGARSLDDFARSFFGGTDSPPEVRPYRREDVIQALSAIEPYDWAQFFAERVDAVAPRPPLGGIFAAGYKLVYDTAANPLMSASDSVNKQLNLTYSVGLLLAEDGTVLDAPEGLPAALSGVAPGMKVVAINGRRQSTKRWQEALAAKAPIDLILENLDAFLTVRIAYRGGERQPHLVRGAGPDLLSAILAPRTR